MKGYAVLLGAILTAIYGYAAQAAMTADIARVWATSAETRAAAGDDRIWYGGVLAPVTVVAWAVQPAVISHRASTCESRSGKG